MKDAFALIYPELPLLLLIIILLFSTSNARVATTTMTKPTQLSMKLVHRDSILSPYYNPSATISERFWRDINSSMARYEYLNARTRSTFSTSEDVRGGLISASAVFFLFLSIGQPPVPQLVIMDTGSSILWIQCSPCTKCFQQRTPMFDPSKSSTYRNLPCYSPYCVYQPPDHKKCDAVGICEYHAIYEDNTSTRGTFGTEEFHFVTSDGGTTSIPDMVFGCGTENKGSKSQESGILGLGPTNVSLVSHISGSRFSYCIGDIDNPHYEYNQLIIGDGAIIEGYSTPLQVVDDWYHLTLEGISVGDKRLDINPNIFRRRVSGEGGVMIDSGTTVIYLHRGGYDQLKEEVINLIGGLLSKANLPDQPEWLCYNGRVNQDLKGFPVVTFHFAGGADLVLDVEAIFRQKDDFKFCMAVRPSESLTIIGIRAQQYYNVAYDLNAMKVYFQRIDCELLED